MPVPKPQPKIDLMITNAFKGHQYGKNVFAYTPESKQWVEHICPQFGHLIYPASESEDMDGVIAFIEHRPKRNYRLIIDRCYDPEEIVEYILKAYPEWLEEQKKMQVWENWDWPDKPINEDKEHPDEE